MALSPEKIQAATLSASNKVDMKEFDNLWHQSDWKNIQYIIADKGYDYLAVRQQISKAGKTAVIPRRNNAIFPGVSDKEHYKTRSAIERFFGKIKENKRLALRFDKLDTTFLSFFAVACLKVLNLLC